MKYGAIDIGTNAARLLIGEVVHDDNRSFVKKISYTRIPIRLGNDVFSLGRVDVKKKSNLINTMKAFEIITDIFEVSHLQAFATSAMREAENADQIVMDIKSATGIDLKIISGAEEANVILGTFMLLEPCITSGVHPLKEVVLDAFATVLEVFLVALVFLGLLTCKK